MEPAIYALTENARIELRDFVGEGLQDMYDNKLLDFNTAFDELEERYRANG
ncbi:MAG: hypothetical protein HDR17_02935 [Lachnospiraceae bacterium]|nr:hypothetical protein [Lachnospiraceae bacterium]